MRKIKTISVLAGILVVLTVISCVSGGIRAEADSALIGTWRGFRRGAISFTFDKSDSNHVSHVAPLFDKYGYKATFYVDPDWSTDWGSLQKLSDNGHEVGSNSITFPANEEGEEKSSKEEVDANIKSKYGCITLAYPKGNVPSDTSYVEANYIAARTYNDDKMTINGPSSWFRVPIHMTGSSTSYSYI